MKPLPDDTLSSSSLPSLPPTHVIAPRVIYGNETSRPDPRHGATRHGTVVWPWTAAPTTAAACWPWRVKFKVSNNWSESNRGLQSEWENKEKWLELWHKTCGDLAVKPCFLWRFISTFPGISPQTFGRRANCGVCNYRFSQFHFSFRCYRNKLSCLYNLFSLLLHGCCAVLGTHCDDGIASGLECYVHYYYYCYYFCSLFHSSFAGSQKYGLPDFLLTILPKTDYTASTVTAFCIRKYIYIYIYIYIYVE